LSLPSANAELLGFTAMGSISMRTLADTATIQDAERGLFRFLQASHFVVESAVGLVEHETPAGRRLALTEVAHGCYPEIIR
jgi:hypothetical protein